MSVAARQLLPFAVQTYVRDLEGLYEPWAAAPVPGPELLVLGDGLARELGADPDALRSRDGIALLLGTGAPGGLPTVAQGYAGHQFGGWSPRLGDGRAAPRRGPRRGWAPTGRSPEGLRPHPVRARWGWTRGGRPDAP